jgi:hypothetical protein
MDSCCPDCGTGMRGFHCAWCLLARCPVSADPRLSCKREGHPDGCGNSQWTGMLVPFPELTRQNRYAPAGQIVTGFDGGNFEVYGDLVRCRSCASLLMDRDRDEDLHERLHPRIHCRTAHLTRDYHEGGHPWEYPFRD